jgi:hypothetical protein
MAPVRMTFETASAVGFNPGTEECLMRKFGLARAAALIVAGFGGWIAATSQARLAPPMSSASIAPMQIMAASTNLPTEHFVDYSLVYP